jgi:hypothetical protein
VSKIIEGFITTTHVDEFGTRVTLDQLKSIMNSLDKMPLSTMEHDPTRPMTGKVIKKEIRKLDDGEFGLWARVEVFNEQLIKLIESGTIKGFSISLIESLNKSKILNFRLDDRVFTQKDLEMLESEITDENKKFIDIGLSYHRSADITPIIQFFLVIGVSFATVFGARLGQNLADELSEDIINVYRKMKDKIKSFLHRKGHQNFFYIMIVKFDDLKIEISSEHQVIEDLKLKLKKIGNILVNIEYPVNKKDIVEIKLNLVQDKIILVSLMSKDNYFIFEKGIWKKVR